MLTLQVIPTDYPDPRWLEISREQFTIAGHADPAATDVRHRQDPARSSGGSPSWPNSTACCVSTSPTLPRRCGSTSASAGSRPA
ncbi:MAG: hypothetical protein MZW92_53905 [Comamonadaceae bacterium]|nr:hypothetical protein [Comamonadaceae bacterium]